jgi:hypothetical protein
MANPKDHSQPQQTDTVTSTPMTPQAFMNTWNQASGTWQKTVQDQIKTAQSFWGEYERMANETTQLSQNAIDEMARIAKDSLDAGSKVASAWRRMSIDAARRITEATIKDEGKR